MLIDETFFTGELHIEGVISCTGVPSKTNEASNYELKSLIAQYELEFYRKILGYDNAKKFVGYIESGEGEEKWDNLKNMLVEQVGNRKVSPVAYYVFFFYLRKNQTQATPIGNVEESSSNKISPCNIKMINAWNQMAYMNRYISDYLYDHRDDYGGYFFDEHLLEFMNKMGI